MPDAVPKALAPRGNYRDLLAYKKAEIIYDITYRFCDRFIDRRDRTTDQMIQAARSGKQNIAEGCKAAVASTESELKLVNVARASLEELLLDYEDYLRTRKLSQWPKDSKKALYARRLAGKPNATYLDFEPFVETRSDEVVANLALCLIHQTNYLLDQYLRRLDHDFVTQGGIRERMSRARLTHRNQS